MESHIPFDRGLRAEAFEDRKEQACSLRQSDKEELHRVICHLDKLLAERDMTLVELSDLVGITVANLSILKNDRARVIRFST